MSEEILKTRDLLSLLQQFSSSTLEKLYAHAPACLAVYRELPAVAKQYIARLLFLTQDVPISLLVVKSWSSLAEQNACDQIVEKLVLLQIWKKHSMMGGTVGITMTKSFQDNIRTSITGGGTPWAQAGHVGEDKHGRDAQYIVKYAEERWEGILNYIVSSPADYNGIIRDVLVDCGLMSVGSQGGEPKISKLGFQFLLLSKSNQVWYFVTQYLNLLQKYDMDNVECLVFLLQISFLTVGKDYAIEAMTDSQLKLLQHLREFGLIYQRKRTSKRYYPTHLAVNLFSGAKSTEEGEKRHGFLVLETNYHITAYTDSELQIAILGLFCQLQYRFPNMVMGVITRDSIHEALKNGITAEQVLSFIRSHAHTQMLSKQPIIPPTITDQIRLWERERDRLQFSDGVLYDQFMSMVDFETVKQYAQEIGVLVWQNDSKRLLVVSRGGHDQVKRFWKNVRQGR